MKKKKGPRAPLSWSQFLVDYGRGYLRDPQAPAAKAIEAAESFLAGRYCDDSEFHSWSGKAYLKWSDATGFKGPMVTPREVFESPRTKGRLEFCAVGQPDGPGTTGVVWITQYWTRSKGGHEKVSTRAWSRSLEEAASMSTYLDGKGKGE